MRRTQVTDCRGFSFDAACMYAALIDFGSYPGWWPSELRLKVLSVTADLVGSRFEVRPPGGSFVCEVVGFVDQRELHIRYVDGLHRGPGFGLCGRTITVLGCVTRSIWSHRDLCRGCFRMSSTLPQSIPEVWRKFSMACSNG